MLLYKRDEWVNYHESGSAPWTLAEVWMVRFSTAEPRARNFSLLHDNHADRTCPTVNICKAIMR